MAVELNHTIVDVRDADASAAWVADVLGLDPPRAFWHFRVVEVANGVSLDFSSSSGSITPQHYAFLVSEAEFDAIHERITARGIDHWADPGRTQPGRINHHDGGRGCYFQDLDGHLLEIITRPYGSGA